MFPGPARGAPSFRKLSISLWRWPRDWGGLLTGFIVLLVLIDAFGIATGWAGIPAIPIVSSVMQETAIILNVLLAARAARSVRHDVRVRRAWILFTLGTLALATGGVGQFYVQGLLRQPMPIWLNLVYDASYPLWFGSLALLASTLPRSHERLMLSLDELTIVVGGGTIVWYFVLGPIALSAHRDLLALAVFAVGPIGDLALVLGLAIVSLRIR